MRPPQIPCFPQCCAIMLLLKRLGMLFRSLNTKNQGTCGSLGIGFSPPVLTVIFTYNSLNHLIIYRRTQDEPKAKLGAKSQTVGEITCARPYTPRKP